MVKQKQCVTDRHKPGGTYSGFGSWFNSPLRNVGMGLAADAQSQVYYLQRYLQRKRQGAGKSLVRNGLRLGVGVTGLGLLSGCSVDMSRFAGALGGATAEFTCAIVQLLFACEL